MSERPPPDPPPSFLAWAETDLGREILALPARFFHAKLEGEERIPKDGGALLVSNHAFLGLDGPLLLTMLWQRSGRYVRFLGERNLWRFSPLGALFTAFGAVPGEPGAAVRLLSEGHLVGVYPGGVDDSFKLSTERHVLKWGTRAGFARVAMQAKVPIIPIAGLGIDDMFDVVAREHWIGRRLFGSARYDLPIPIGAFGLPIPRRARVRFVVLPPVDTSGDPDDGAAVERVRRETHDAIEERLRIG